MLFEEYSYRAIQFADYESSEYPFLALGEKTAELLLVMSDFLREVDMSDGGISPKSAIRQQLINELGDVLFQVNSCCFELGTDMSAVAKANAEKVESEGAINGA